MRSPVRIRVPRLFGKFPRVWCNGSTPPFQGVSTGSNPVTRFRTASTLTSTCIRRIMNKPSGSIAQWSEQSAHNRLVPGSSPGGPTSFIGSKDKTASLPGPPLCSGSSSIPAPNCVHLVPPSCADDDTLGSLAIRSLSHVFHLQLTRSLHFVTHFGVVRTYIDTVLLDRCHMRTLCCLKDALRCPFATLYCPFAAHFAAAVRPWVRARFVTRQSSCAMAIGNSLTFRIGIGIRRKDLL